MPPTADLYGEFLAASDIPYSEETVQHLSHFLDALRVHSQRSKSYSDAWRHYGALSNLLTMARKIDRLMAVHWNPQGRLEFHKDELDDAVDLLNYTVFFMRNVNAGNTYGSPPARPTSVEVPPDLTLMADDKVFHQNTPHQD